MTRLKAGLRAALCLGLSAGAAAAQSPTAVMIDLSTAGAQPGATLSQRISMPSTYTPPEPQRAFPNEGPTGWDSPASSWTSVGGASADDLTIVRAKSFFSAKPMDFAAPVKGESLLALTVVSLLEGALEGGLGDSGFITTPLRVTGPVQPASGRLAAGQTLVAAPVVHQLRGRLKAPLGHVSGMKDLPVGTEFYGVQMQLFGLKKAAYGVAANSGATIWCAPQPGKSDVTQDADCFIPMTNAKGSTFRYWRMSSNWPDLRFDDTAGVARPLDVEEDPAGPATPMMGFVRFVKWKGQAATVSFVVEADGVSTVLSRGDIKRQPDGSVLVQAFGNLFHLTPAGKDGRDALVEAVPASTDKAPSVLAQAGAAPFAPG
jgi:hypothetical protein